MAITHAFAKDHINRWINAWNNHDLDALLSMYSEKIQFSSPKIKTIFPNRKYSKLSNKKELKEYWTLALERFPNLKFEAKELIIHNDVIIFEYFAALNGVDSILVIEKFEFENNTIVQSSVFYGAEDSCQHC